MKWGGLLKKESKAIWSPKVLRGMGKHRVQTWRSWLQYQTDMIHQNPWCFEGSLRFKKARVKNLHKLQVVVSCLKSIRFNKTCCPMGGALSLMHLWHEAYWYGGTKPPRSAADRCITSLNFSLHPTVVTDTNRGACSRFRPISWSNGSSEAKNKSAKRGFCRRFQIPKCKRCS